MNASLSVNLPAVPEPFCLFNIFFLKHLYPFISFWFLRNVSVLLFFLNSLRRVKFKHLTTCNTMISSYFWELISVSARDLCFVFMDFAGLYEYKL